MATAGKHCYVLRTDKGKFLALGHNSVIKRDPTSDNPNMAAIEGHSDIVFNSVRSLPPISGVFVDTTTATARRHNEVPR